MSGERFRLTRGGIVNVWQYDNQVFDFGGGRLLLRGTNGAGKSKTLEMLLPFVLDGDKSRITASGRHHTSLLWLMLDGFAGQTRTGYLWVEFQRRTETGDTQTVTCGVGLRASESARTATTWFFTSPRRVGVDLHLSDASGPLPMQRLRAEVETDGHFFDSNATRRYREHVGQLLFGLPLDQFEDLLRLLYWLRQPQVGEDIDPRRLAEQLVQALPQVDEAAIRAAGDTFDQLEEFGEQIDRQQRSATALKTFLETYAAYARGVLETRARAVVGAEEEERRCQRAVRRVGRELDAAGESLDQARNGHAVADTHHSEAVSRITQLMAGPEARAQQRLLELESHLRTKRQHASEAQRRLAAQHTKMEHEQRQAERDAAALMSSTRAWGRLAQDGRSAGREAALPGILAQSALVSIGELLWQHEESGHPLRTALTGVVDEIGEARDRVGVARAAVKVVDEALSVATSKRSDSERAEEASGAADAQAAQRRSRLTATAAAAQAHGEDLSIRLAAWAAEPAAVPVELPATTEEALAAFDGRVVEAIAPVRSERELRRATASVAASRSEAERRDLLNDRARVESETNPLPVPPSWRRGPRSQGSGAPFWQLVDFADGVSEAGRAQIEAALEGSGLLDAWVSPGGRVSVDREDLFAVSGLAGAAHAPHLGEVLRIDVPDDSPVDSSVVAAVLASVALVETTVGHAPFGDGASTEGDPNEADALNPRSGLVIGRDGGWRAGPLVGRTSKTVAQFVGATARASERQRRLAVLDARLAEHEELIDEARAVMRAETEALNALQAWQRLRPSHHELVRAWAAEHQAELSLEEALAGAASARHVAEAARSAAVSAHGDLVSLGEIHGLPITRQALQARGAVLVDLGERLSELSRSREALLRGIARWEDQARRCRSEAQGVHDLTVEADQATTESERTAADLDELRSAAGASIDELRRRLAELASERDRAERERNELASLVESLIRRQAMLEADLLEARRRLEVAAPARELAVARLQSLERAPGLVDSALGTSAPAGAADPTTAAGQLEGEPGSAAYGSGVELEARALLEAIPEGRRADDTAVVSASQALGASAAAALEPRITQVDDAWVAFGIGEGGEVSLVELERRLSATVLANKDLLSQRERQIFEEQVLGYLGDSLRAVRLKAFELVAAMNEQLTGVKTSQGIAVRLRWRLRDDIPADAKRAVELLGQPVDALLADERVELRESLHRLIDASRADAPEDAYADHLARALDYRRWFGFSVQYHRPETGEWRDLQRKSALSQGEQKVLCYLPLFAAAAAHFTSVAGAAPHAPRFVLLDDAFPKIDARTHPLLFGLLVDLDLDFVITSERLWGTHATVPELAIYEALRSPGERGIAQFEHRWDGQQLTAVGASGG